MFIVKKKTPKTLRIYGKQEMSLSSALHTSPAPHLPFEAILPQR